MKRRGIYILLVLATVLTLACRCEGGMLGVHFSSGMDIEASQPPSVEIKTWHQNPGTFMLESGHSANAGHILITDENGNIHDFLCVDNRVVVIRNFTGHGVELYAPDGAGIHNTTDYGVVVLARFVEGCDQDGCGEICLVDIQENGVFTDTVRSETP